MSHVALSLGLEWTQKVIVCDPVRAWGYKPTSECCKVIGSNGTYNYKPSWAAVNMLTFEPDSPNTSHPIEATTLICCAKFDGRSKHFTDNLKVAISPPMGGGGSSLWNYGWLYSSRWWGVPCSGVVMYSFMYDSWAIAQPMEGCLGLLGYKEHQYECRRKSG